MANQALLQFAQRISQHADFLAAHPLENAKARSWLELHSMLIHAFASSVAKGKDRHQFDYGNLNVNDWQNMVARLQAHAALFEALAKQDYGCADELGERLYLSLGLIRGMLTQGAS